MLKAISKKSLIEKEISKKDLIGKNKKWRYCCYWCLFFL
tara:strand:+ start:149 stop:265 length:117 start_codon:yes stop_codon:yes gene_type:complete